MPAETQTIDENIPKRVFVIFEKKARSHEGWQPCTTPFLDYENAVEMVIMYGKTDEADKVNPPCKYRIYDYILAPTQSSPSSATPSND
jgi:hypothetical protein